MKTLEQLKEEYWQSVGQGDEANTAWIISLSHEEMKMVIDWFSEESDRLSERMATELKTFLDIEESSSSYISDTTPPQVIAGTTSELLTRLLAGKCELCGSPADLEAHHVNKLKDLRKRWQGKHDKPKWVEHMIARRRKTVVVCHACHQQITHGRYDGQRVNQERLESGVL
jgi:hypothetical protein